MNQQSSSHSISFVIASYNDEMCIEKTLCSILKNRRKGDQIILIDGASSDNTVENAKNTLDQVPQTIVISEPDGGIYEAWNKALTITTSTWIAFLGCGDILEDSYRNNVSNALNQDTTLNFIHGIAQIYKADGKKNVGQFKFGGPFEKRKFKKEMRVCHVGSLHHESLFNDIKFSTDYKCVSDYHFLLQKVDDLKPFFINQVLVNMESGGISSKLFFPRFEERKMKSDLGLSNNLFLWLELLASIIKSSIFRANSLIKKLIN